MVVVWAASKVHSFNPYFLGSLTLFISKKSNLLLKVISIYYFIRSCSLFFRVIYEFIDCNVMKN